MRIFSPRSTAFVLLALLITVILTACQPVQPVAEMDTPAPALAEYADENGFFTASYPQDWISDSDVFADAPFPGVGFATSNEIIELSMAEQLLPEGEIGVALMLIPDALLPAMGLAGDAPLDEVLRAILIDLGGEDGADMAEELLTKAIVDQFTLANGAPAVRAIVDGETESYDLTAADLSDGITLISFQIMALGYRNAELEAQADTILGSVELTASPEEVTDFVMAQMGAMEEMGASVPTVTITASEYAYAGPESVPGGLTRIELANEGEQAHSMYMVKLEDGKSVDDLMEVLAAIESDPEIPDWLLFYGGVEAAPGASAAYTIDLAPGDYAYFSFSTDEEEVPDVAKGMLGTLTVSEAADTGAAPPQTDVRLEMVDYSFVIDGEMVAGPQIIEVTNTGMEPHETVLLKLGEGVGVQDFVDFMMAETPSEPPSLDFFGTFAPMSPGLTAWYETELESGEYGLICFFPSGLNGGAPHFALGMTRQLTVP